MALAIQEMIDNVTRYRFNPASIQRVALRGLAEINNGQQLYFDATNPFIQALQCGAVETAAFMQSHEAECRRRYPCLAQTQEDLYLHMSDQAYINRFAVPAQANFSFRFFKPELVNAMVYDNATGYTKLVIPRNTYFTVGGTVFSLQYPIDVRQLANGALSIVYNNEQVSPLQTLESNSIPYEIQDGAEGEYVKFDVLATQFNITQMVESISKAKDVSIAMPITDQIYFARVYHKNSATGKWDELATTHAASIYDATKPTAVLHVADGVLQVKIPQVYVRTGLLYSNIRVDMYETKGAINLPLAEYPSNAFSITWKAFDSSEQSNVFSAPLPNMNVNAFSNEIVIGGRNEMGFEELRKNVINNATGPIHQPVTEAQLEAQLRNAGYDIVKGKDNITDRIYLATREMPSPELVTATTAASTGNKLLTAAAASIETLTVATESLAGLPTVIDNGDSITITPDTLYQIVDGIAQPVPQSDVENILSMPADKRALAVTNGNFLYTPFHYVLDSSNASFEIRPYYLDNPMATSKVFVKQNDTTLMLVGTSLYGLVRTTTGFIMQVQTRSDDVYKSLPDSQVFAQMAFIPHGERDRAYVNGVMVGKTSKGERIFNFDLSTTFNVDSSDNMEMTKFTMYNTEPRITKTALLNSFDVIYSTSVVLTSRWTPNEVDEVLGRHLLPNQIAGINHEQIRIKFGEPLDMLWTRARTVASSITYQVWEEDLQAFYKEDVFEYGADGLRLSVVEGQLVYNKLHLKGDPILGPEEAITYEHRKGDLKRDSSGQLIPANPRGLKRQIDLMLLEGVYWFATDETTANYRTTLTRALVSWLVNDLESFKTGLLDKTRIYFYPKTTSGTVNVYLWDDVRKAISAGQSFNVTLAVSKQVHENLNLRDRLEVATIQVLSTMLQQKTVSTSQMLEALRKKYGSDVIDVQLSGLGGEFNYPVLTMADDTDRLSIRKRLVALADGKLAAEEDVTVAFVIHKGKSAT
jgi:hypothetical protein